MRKTAFLAPLVVLIAVGALAACAPPPVDSGRLTPPGAASAEPSASPSDEPVVATTAHHIGVGPTLISIMDADNLAYEVIHDGMTAADSVPILTTAFGAEPTVGHGSAGTHTDGATTYDWSGFVFIVWDHPTVFAPNTWSVRVDTPAVGGIPIYAGTSIQVGDPMSEAIAEEFGHDAVPGLFYQAKLYRTPVDPVSVGQAAGTDTYLYLTVRGDSAAGPVLSLISHGDNWSL